MSKKLFIFDLDGVLVEACNWHRDALNEALLEICNFKISQEEHEFTFNGIPTSKKLQILTNRGLVAQIHHQKINDLKQEKTLEIIERCATLRQEKIDMILSIREAGHTVCCYTNSIRKTASLMLRKTGIEHLFDYVLTNQDVDEPKPSPEGYLFLMEKFNFDKKDTFIIEDSPKGVAAATSSGANVLVVKNAGEVNISIVRNLI
jgi:HAD superfamily hydrolase (TIGR01509 family)